MPPGRQVNLPSAGAPPEFGPPPFPGGTRTFPAYPRISFGGLSPSHLGVASPYIRGVEAARPTPHRNSRKASLLRGGSGLF